jgi:hypothetical protein
VCVAARGAAVVTCWQVNNHRKILEDELELVGMRLNKQPPQIQFTKKKTGGIKFNSTVTLTQLGDDPQQAVRLILAECVTAPHPARGWRRSPPRAVARPPTGTRRRRAASHAPDEPPRCVWWFG